MAESFADPNLGLAVLQSMVDERLEPAPEWAVVKAANPYDPDDDGFDWLDLSEPDYATRYQEVCAYQYLNTAVRSELLEILDGCRSRRPPSSSLPAEAGTRATNVLEPPFCGSAVITTDIARLDIHGPNCTDPVGPGKIVFRDHRDQNHASEHWYT